MSCLAPCCCLQVFEPAAAALSKPVAVLPSPSELEKRSLLLVPGEEGMPMETALLADVPQLTTVGLPWGALADLTGLSEGALGVSVAAVGPLLRKVQQGGRGEGVVQSQEALETAIASRQIGLRRLAGCTSGIADAPAGSLPSAAAAAAAAAAGDDLPGTSAAAAAAAAGSSSKGSLLLPLQGYQERSMAHRAGGTGYDAATWQGRSKGDFMRPPATPLPLPLPLPLPVDECMRQSAAVLVLSRKQLSLRHSMAGKNVPFHKLAHLLTYGSQLVAVMDDAETFAEAEQVLGRPASGYQHLPTPARHFECSCQPLSAPASSADTKALPSCLLTYLPDALPRRPPCCCSCLSFCTSSALRRCPTWTVC